MFKFDLGQLVYYLVNGKVHSAPILSRMFVENSFNDEWMTGVQKEFFQPFGRGIKKYSTCHGQFAEKDLFKSSEELLTAMQNIAVSF